MLRPVNPVCGTFAGRLSCGGTSLGSRSSRRRFCLVRPRHGSLAGQPFVSRLHGTGEYIARCSMGQTFGGLGVGGTRITQVVSRRVLLRTQKGREVGYQLPALRTAFTFSFLLELEPQGERHVTWRTCCAGDLSERCIGIRTGRIVQSIRSVRITWIEVIANVRDVGTDDELP